MSETAHHPSLPIDLDAVGDWVTRQRWYASKSLAISALEIAEAVEVSTDPSLAILLAQTRFTAGARDLYQLPLSLLDADAVGERPVVAAASDGRVVVDAVADPELARFTPGTYTIYFGLFVGDTRLKVLSGPNDGDNRINGGPLRVQ